MAVRDALPVAAALVQRHILRRPVAELLQANVDLLCGGREVLECSRVRSKRSPIEQRNQDFGHDTVGHEAEHEHLRGDGPDVLVESLFEPEEDEFPEVGGGFNDALTDALAAFKAHADETDVALHKLVDFGRAIDLTDDGAEGEFFLRSGVFDNGVEFQLLDETVFALLFDFFFLVDSIKWRHGAECASSVAQGERDGGR